MPADERDALEALTLGALLDLVASEERVPGGGAVGALAVALAASLLEGVARGSTEHWDEARAAATQARALRVRALALADENAAAYREARAALASAREWGPLADDEAIGRAMRVAADVPLRIAGAGADVVTLAEQLADEGHPDLAADAAAALLVAESGVRVAAHLLSINLVAGRDDDLAGRARELAHSSAQAARRLTA